MTIDEMIAVLEAAKRGEKIQDRMADHLNQWADCLFPVWNFHDYEYRAKPKPREWWVVEGSRYMFDDPCAAANAAGQVNARAFKVREVIDE